MRDQKIMEYMALRTARLAREKEETEALIRQILEQLTQAQRDLALAREKQNELERELRDAAEKIKRGEIASQKEREQ